MSTTNPEVRSGRKPPNILLIMSDQHHPRFLGCAGHPLLQTPHLDALAIRGTRFENAYCNFPLCGPSRMSFLTSRYPSEIQLLSNLSQLGSNVPTIAHAFNAVGYDTVLCGRMHFNGPDQRHGFRERLAGDVMGANKNSPSMAQVLGSTLSDATGPRVAAIKKSGPGETGYQAYDEEIASRTAQWLANRSDEENPPPFFMVVGLVLPHAPFVTQPDDFAFYNPLITTEDLPSPHPDSLHPALREIQHETGLDAPDSVTTEDQRLARVAYHGLCTHLDRLVGRILNGLDTSAFADNTIVVYTSDHGEQLGEHGMWWKQTFYEGSVGIPLIMAGPGIPRGKTKTANVSLLDLGPSLLDLAGAPALPSASGRSFRCLLEGHGEIWHDRVIAENLWPRSSRTLNRMIKKGPWKLCYYPGHPGHPIQLFHLNEDPGEHQDRSQDPACQMICQSLLSELLHHWDHDAIMNQRARDFLTESWIDSSWIQCDMSDPDPPWFGEPPTNAILEPSLK